MIDRSEASGLSLAVIGHVVLFGLLSVGFLATPNPTSLRQNPVEVSLVGEVGLESLAPIPSDQPMAAKLSPVEAPVEPDDAPSQPAPEPEPQPVARPDPAPARPAPSPKAQPKRATPPNTRESAQRPPTQRPVRPSGNLDGLDLGKTNTKSNSKSLTPPSERASPQVQRALAAEILRQIKPHWKPPSGADSEKLRTTVSVRLARDGSIVGEPEVRQDGITPSNRAQATLHRERAVRAVRLAAPFNLPANFYDAWKEIEPTLYEDL